VLQKKRDFLEKAGKRPGKTILITGGQLSNLGVQAKMKELESLDNAPVYSAIEAR